MFDRATRRNTLIKPVQSGGSTAGQLVIAAQCKFGFGEIQYNWQDDGKAFDEFTKDIIPMLEKCSELRWRGDRFDLTKAQAKFIQTLLTCQGVKGQGHLDSDTIPFQVNEELHLWKMGDLGKARRRQTACFLPKSFDISNAGYARPKGNVQKNESFELYDAFMEGTQQHWQVLCPGCKKFHVMRTRWEENRPELGGLRYDSAGCKRMDGSFNYTQMIPTIRYQMPCGYPVPFDIKHRRPLSESGRYSDPRPDAYLPFRSYILEAVSCHHISWLELIQEKHQALRARQHGDREAWRRYVTERECQFYSEDNAPLSGVVITTSRIKKNREGLKLHPDFATRLWAADKQKGFKSRGELTHYWLVIEDVLKNCDSQIVFEGMIQTEQELFDVLKDHECQPSSGMVDASWDTKNVLEMCLRAGYNAAMGNESHRGSFLHPDGVRRFYANTESIDQTIFSKLNTLPKFNRHPTKDGWVNDPLEPVVFVYNKAGLLANHFFIRDHKLNVEANGGKDFILVTIPSDVSEDFISQNESWERVELKQAKHNDEVEGFKKVRSADHLLMCRAYIDMLKEWSGLLGDRLSSMGIVK